MGYRARREAPFRAAILTCAAAVPWPAALAQVATEVVSVNTAGTAAGLSLPGGGVFAFGPGLLTPLRGRFTADGRYVVFESTSLGLTCNLDGIGPNRVNLFVRDRLTQSTAPLIVTPDGSPPDQSVAHAMMTPDGRYVVFVGEATNLVAGDTNGFADVFVRDRVAGTTERVSIAQSGEQSGGRSFAATISDDGRYVAFVSDAPNLVADDSNGRQDVFVRDRVAGTTQRVSVTSAGNEAFGDSYSGSMSADGRHVAFTSTAGNLMGGAGIAPAAIFVHDRQLGTTSLASRTPGGGMPNLPAEEASISADGRYVAYISRATDLVSVPIGAGFSYQIYLYDRQTGTTVLVSGPTRFTPGDHDARLPSISGDGRYVAYESWSTNLIPGSVNDNWNIFRYDAQTGVTERLTTLAAQNASISRDGQHVLFGSTSRLAANDTNFSFDTYSYGPVVAVAPAGLAFSPAAYEVEESAAAATITVTRAGNACVGASVEFATFDGSASAGFDYTAAAGTLSFSPGATSRTFEVQIRNDGQPETTETLTINLSNPQGAPLAGASASATLTIVDDDVGGVNRPPVAASDAYSLAAGSSLTVGAPGVLGNDTDADGDTLAAVLVSGPSSGALTLAPDGGFVYVPAAGFQGTDGFTYRARDAAGALSDVATVALTVTPAITNRAPVAAGDAYAVVAGEVLEVAAPGVFANDSDPDGDSLTAALASSPARGTLELRADGSFVYTPASGYVGLDSFAYRASDAAASSPPVAVQLIVTSAGIVPVAGTATPIPGGGGTFAGFVGPPAIGGLDLVFVGRGANGQQGLYRLPYVGAPAGFANEPVLLADLATPIPGGIGAFTAFAAPSLAFTPGDPCREAVFVGGGAGIQQGIYAAQFGAPSCSASVLRIADTATAIPGGAGAFATFGPVSFAWQPGDPCREAVFVGGAGAQRGVYAASFGAPASCANAPVLVADVGTPIPGGIGVFETFSNVSLVTTPGDPCHEAAFIGRGAGAQQGVYAASFGAPASCAPALVRIADLATSIPDGTGVFETFDHVSLVTTPGDPCHEAVFIGSGAAAQQGVYSREVGAASCSGAAVRIADRSTPIPQGQGTFTGFGALSADGGHVAFLGTGAGGQGGIYLASTLTKIVDRDDTIGGRALDDLELGPEGLSGNRLAFTAKFADGTSSVVVVTVRVPGEPEPPIACADDYTATSGVQLRAAAPGVLGNDADVDGEQLEAVLASPTQNGTLALNADGSFVYTPAASFVGEDRFVYFARDTSGVRSNDATVVIAVAPPADSTPPVLTLPANITAAASSAAGAVVTFVATATDSVDGPVAVACSPASGATFAVDTTPVSCSARDSNGNVATGGFTVTVTPLAGASSRLDALVQLVRGPGARDDVFALEAILALAADSDGIQPPRETTTLTLGDLSWTVAANAFKRTILGGYLFGGVVNGTRLDIAIQPLGRGKFLVVAAGSKADLGNVTNPVRVSFTVGNDSSATTVTARIK